MTTALDSYAEHATRGGQPSARTTRGAAPAGTHEEWAAPRSRDEEWAAPVGTHEGWAAPRLHDEEGDNTANTRGPRSHEQHAHTSNALAGRGKGGGPNGPPPLLAIYSVENRNWG